LKEAVEREFQCCRQPIPRGSNGKRPSTYLRLRLVLMYDKSK